MIYVAYRINGKLVQQFVPADVGEQIARAAVQHGADHHVMQGTWSTAQRRHVEPEITGSYDYCATLPSALGPVVPGAAPLAGADDLLS